MKAQRALVATLFLSHLFSLQVSGNADALLQAVGEPKDTQSAQYLTNDPFLEKLFIQWKTHSANLNYDVNSWIQFILKSEFRKASHLWSSIESKIGSEFYVFGQAAHLYTLWKVGLSSVFIEQWLNALSNPKFIQSPLTDSLHQAIRPGFDKWLVSQALLPSSEKTQTWKVVSQNNDPIFITLKAWLSLRNPTEAEKILELLPESHEFKLFLSLTVGLYHAKKNNISKAAQILKKHLEPALAMKNDSSVVTSYWMLLARLMYQAGALDGAEQFYLKIPNGSDDFLQAREELIWVWLRKGEGQKLRGELKTLKSKVFEDLFSPEVFTVRAISNLKLCLYDEVENDFKEFQKIYSPWAKNIEHALNAVEPPQPPKLDFFSKQSLQAVELRLKELALLDELSKESISAVLPAVGPQAHWEKYKKELSAHIEQVKKQKITEYRRIWKNQALVLQEAIRKLQFVKVEFLSQLKIALKNKNISNPEKISVSALKKGSQEIVFPFDGVVWPDEFFKLRSLAQQECLNKIDKQ